VSEALSKILELIVACWRALCCWDVLPAEEIGFIRRLGKYSRRMRPGWNWRWPLIETAEKAHGQEGIYILDPQSLRTRDGVFLVLRMSVTFRIVNARKYHLKAWGALNNLRDLVAGEVGEVVRSAQSEDVFNGVVTALALKNVRKQAARWGVRIVRLRSCDMCPATSVRRWNTNTSAAGED
jgi:regulator of protease activity HflC (stomatin/prohibitin superfamily)